jgi:hypothetical protein
MPPSIARCSVGDFAHAGYFNHFFGAGVGLVFRVRPQKMSNAMSRPLLFPHVSTPSVPPVGLRPLAHGLGDRQKVFVASFEQPRIWSISSTSW